MPYQTCPTPPMTPALFAACREAFHLITPAGEVWRAGRAAIYLLEELGYPRWLVQPWRRRPLVGFTEFGYRLVADHRSFFARFIFTKE